MVSRGRPKKKVVTRVESCNISTPGNEPVVLNIHVHIHSPIGSDSQSVASNAQPILHLHLDNITKDLISSAISQKLSPSPGKSISAVRGRKSKKSPTASPNALSDYRRKNASCQSEVSDSSFDGFNPIYTSSQRQINDTDNLVEKIEKSQSECDSVKNNGNETIIERHVYKQCSLNTYHPLITDESNIEKDNKCKKFHMSLRPRRQDVKYRKPNESSRGKRKSLRLRNSRISLSDTKNYEESSGSLDDAEVGNLSCSDEEEIDQREEHESVNNGLVTKSITESVPCGENVESSVPKSTVNDSSCKNDSNNFVQNVPGSEEDSGKSDYSDNELEISKSSISLESDMEENQSEVENITDSFTLLLNASGGKGKVYARVYTPDKIASPEKIVIDEQASSIIDDLNFKELRQRIFAEESDNQILLKCKSFPPNEEPEKSNEVVNSVLNGSDIMSAKNDCKSDDGSKNEEGLIIKSEVDESGKVSDKNSDVLVQTKNEPQTMEEELESSVKSKTQTSTPIAKKTNSTFLHEPETREEELGNSIKSETQTSTPIAKETNSSFLLEPETRKEELESSIKSKTQTSTLIAKETNSVPEFGDERNLKSRISNNRFTKARRIKKSLELPSSSSEEEEEWMRKVERSKKRFFSLERINTSLEKSQCSNVTEVQDSGSEDEIFRVGVFLNGKHGRALNSNWNRLNEETIIEKSKANRRNSDTRSGRTSSSESEQSVVDNKSMKEDQRNERKNSLYDEDEGISVGGEDSVLRIDENEESEHDGEELEETRKSETFNEDNDDFCHNNRNEIEMEQIISNLDISSIKWEIELENKDGKEVDKRQKFRTNQSEAVSEEVKIDEKSFDEMKREEKCSKENEKEKINESHDERKNEENEDEERECSLHNEGSSWESKVEVSSLSDEDKMEETCKRKNIKNMKRTYEEKQEERKENARMISEEKQMRNCEFRKRAKKSERKLIILGEERIIDETNKKESEENVYLVPGKNDYKNSEQKREEIYEITSDEEEDETDGKNDGTISVKCEERKDEILSKIYETKGMADIDGKNSEACLEEEEKEDETIKQIDGTKRIEVKTRKCSETSSEEEDEAIKWVDKTKGIDNRDRKSSETSSEEEEDETTERISKTRRIDDKARKNSVTSSEEEDTTERENKTKRIDNRAICNSETNSEEEDETTKRENKTKGIDNRDRKSSETSSEEEEEEEDETTERISKTHRIDDKAKKSSETSSEEEEEDTTERENKTKRKDNRAICNSETSSEEEDETTERENKTKGIDNRDRKSSETSSEEEEEEGETTERENKTKGIDNRDRKSSETSSEEEEEEDETTERENKTKGIDNRDRKSSETSSEEEEDEPTERISRTKRIDDRAGDNSEKSSEENEKSQNVEYEENCKIMQRKLNIELMHSFKRGKTKEMDEEKRKGSFISVDNIVGNGDLTKEVDKTRRNCTSPDNIFERWTESESGVSSGISKVRKVIKAVESCPKFAEFRREKNNSSDKYGMGEMLSKFYKQPNMPQPETRNSFNYKNQKFNSSKTKQKDVTEIQLKKLNRFDKNDFVMGLKNKKVKKSKKNKELKRKMSQGSTSPPPVKMSKKGNEQKVEEKKDVKKGSENKDYIPLEVSGPTKFSVAKLNKLSPYVEHDAASFRQRMLFGDRVKRFASSKGLYVCRMKQKAGESCSK